jgi:hypothetical protein
MTELFVRRRRCACCVENKCTHIYYGETLNLPSVLVRTPSDLFFLFQFSQKQLVIIFAIPATLPARPQQISMPMEVMVGWQRRVSRPDASINICLRNAATKFLMNWALTRARQRLIWYVLARRLIRSTCAQWELQRFLGRFPGCER